MNWTVIIVAVAVVVIVLIVGLVYLAYQEMLIKNYGSRAVTEGPQGVPGPAGADGPEGPPGPPCGCSPVKVDARLEELETTVKGYNDRFRRVERKAGLHV